MALLAIFVYKANMKNSTKDNKPKQTPWTARNKMMDLLARRDHSEKDLRKKLKDRFTPEEIDQAIQYGKERQWIPDDETSLLTLAEKTAGAFHRKNKGILYINNYLKEKGLPSVDADPSLELEKALTLVKNKKLNFAGLDRKDAEKVKAKLGRFLVARGFDMSVVRKVIYEELRG